MGSLFKPDVKDTTTKVELPPWLEQYGQYMTGSAQSLADRPYTPYEGDRFAGFNPMQTDAMGSYDLFGQMGLGALGGGYNALTDTTGMGMMGNAYAGLAGLAEQGGPLSSAMFANATTAGPAAQAQASLADRGAIRDVNGGSFLNLDRAAYMNPYTQNVTDNVLSDLDRSWQQQNQRQGAAANAAGAFGGSRHGIVDALTASEYQRNAGQLSNQLWSQAFDAASGLMGMDLNRGLQADMSNQGMDWNVENLNANLGTNTGMFNAGQANQRDQFNVGQTNQNSMFNAGLGTQNNQFNANNQGNTMLAALNGMGNLGNAIGGFTQQQGRNLTDYGISGLAGQMGAGNQMQNFDQQQLDNLYNQFLEARDWQGNQFSQFAPTGMGAQGTTTTTGQAFGPSKASQLAGLGTAGAGMWSAFKGG
jgi:hypothetical protein